MLKYQIIHSLSFAVQLQSGYVFQYNYNSGDIHFLQTVCPQFLLATYLLTEMQK